MGGAQVCVTTPILLDFLQIESPEQFGMLLTNHFMKTYKQVSFQN